MRRRPLFFSLSNGRDSQGNVKVLYFAGDAGGNGRGIAGEIFPHREESNCFSSKRTGARSSRFTQA
jgi:hypothetical protein